MKLTVESKKDKPLVERIECFVSLGDFDSTPSNAQVQEETAKLLGKPKELIVVKRIGQQFGRKEARALVYAYSSETALKKFEPKKKEKKEAAAAAAAESEAKSEA